jgi:hypothetical protein
MGLVADLVPDRCRIHSPSTRLDISLDASIRLYFRTG